MNPKSNLEGFVPKNKIILSAILLCKFQDSIAIAIKNPPRNKNIIELIYESEIFDADKIPDKGKTTNGIKEVTYKGIASVIHQKAIRIATAAVIVIR